MHRPLVASVIAGLLVAAASPAAAIIRRDDKPDDLYVAAAADYPRPVVLRRAPRGASDGMGTFISDRWLVTAAHVAEGLSVGGAVPDEPALVIEAVVLHPGWQGPENDIALVRVRARLDYPAVPVCAVEDVVGAVLVVVGAGDFGDGLTGPTGHDRLLRAADNTIDVVDASTIRFDFDAPASALPLEGIGGPGDSGGPAYIASGAGLCIAGVSSGQLSAPGQRGRYGAVEVYTRTSAYRTWIEGVIAGS